MAFNSGEAGDTAVIIIDQVFRPGMIAMTGASAAPAGFLLCDGAEYDPVLYPALFVAIGTTFNTGGETPGFFRVPAFQARVPVGVGTIGGQVWARGTQVGAESVTLTTAQIPAHNHGVTDPGHNHTQNAHTHTQDAHNHTQDAHTHTQDAHNHTQDAHTHTQDAHTHTASVGGAGYVADAAFPLSTDGGAGTWAGKNYIGSTTPTNQNTTATNQATTATNQNTTATNQATTATNQNTTATNNSNTTGITTNNEGGGGSHNNLQPGLGVNFIIKT